MGSDTVIWDRDDPPRVWVRCTACDAIRIRQARHSRLTRQLRAEYLAGAEQQSRRTLGRGLTGIELRALLRRYPGD